MLYTYHTKEKKGNVISVFIQNYILSVTVRHIPSHYLLFNSVFKDLSTITNLFDRKIRFLSLSNVSYICFWYTKWHFFAFIHPNMLCYRYGAIVTWWNPKILKSAIYPTNKSLADIMAKYCVVISQSPFEDITAFRVRHYLLLVSILTSNASGQWYLG